MSFKLLGGGSDLATVVSDVNQNILELKGREVTEIFKDDSGTRRVLLGKGANGFYGLKVSPEGTDVYTAADDELIFNSDQNVFKIVETGTATVPLISMGAGVSNASQSVTVTHNLGYTPICIAYAVDRDGKLIQLPLLNGRRYINLEAVLPGAGIVMAPYSVAQAEVTTTTVVFSNYAANSNMGSGSTVSALNIKYYLLQETAS